MSHPRIAWVSAGDEDITEDDVDTPRRYTAWVVPQDFSDEDFAAAGFQPLVFNRTRTRTGINNSVESAGAPQRSTPASPSATSQDTATVTTQAQPSGVFQNQISPTSNNDPSLTTQDQRLITAVSNRGQTTLTPNTDNQVVLYNPGNQPAANAPRNNATSFNPLATFVPMRRTLQGPHQRAVTMPGQPGQGFPPAVVPFLPVAWIRAAAGFSPNYQGNIFIDSNRSANILENENCSLFITGLAPNVTVTTLLRGVHNVGRIYATHINDPEPSRGHLTCAAKVTFFDRDAAARFFHRYSGPGLRLPDHPGFIARVVWNRVRTAAVLMPRSHTRVLMISGSPAIVNPAILRAFFSSKFVFEEDTVIDYGFNGPENLVEYRFGSYRCQAESGHMAFSRELGHQVRVEYGRDPCDTATVY